MPVRVLIAEDEWLVGMTLGSQLEHLGYEVVGIARTGAEAVRLCPLCRPDVVLMDVQMPELDGLTATRQLMEVCPQAIAIVTGKSTLRDAAEEAGAMEFAMKPLLDSQVSELIEGTLGRFARYRAVCAEAADCQSGLAAWLVVGRALRQMFGAGGQSEASAFDLLRQKATAQGRSLRETAEAVLLGLDGGPEGRAA